MQSMANMCSPARSAFGVHSNPADRQYLETYEVDKRSVFVGNLPVEILEIDLQQKFEKYGAVRRVTLHKNESTIDCMSFFHITREYYSSLAATQKHCFAFIEFAKATAVPSSIEEMVSEPVPSQKMS
jgi:RNA recognition motif-containing protein